MHVAEWIQVGNLIDAFRNLSIAFSELGAKVSAGGCERVSMNMMPRLMIVSSPDLHVSFLFKGEQCNVIRWVVYACL